MPKLGKLPKNVIRGPWARSALGGVMVVGSVVGVFHTLEGSNETMTVLVAATPLVPGARVSEGDVNAVSVPLHTVFDGALMPSDLTGAMFVTRPVPQGQVVSRESISRVAPNDDTTVTLELAIGRPVWLRAGAVAELWVSPPQGANGFGSPFVVSPSVVVTSVSSDDGFAADALSARVDVLVPRRDLPSVVHALANGFFIALTPVSGPTP